MISGNSADDYGGAIHCYASSPTITNCTITNNAAYGGGGGVYCTQESNPTIGNCTITGNTADDGGGVYCRESSPTITNCTISGNTADGGGGIFCWESSPTIANCVICDNVADVGAGVCCYDSTLTITNCTIAGNTASKFGGGIFCWDSSPTITNCTITGNTASKFGGGGVCCGLSSPTITNCILWDDTPQEIYVISGQPVVSYGDVQGGWEGTGNIDEDPLFADPDGPDDDPNTWEDNDYHLSPGSPCIDAACNWAVPPDTADLDEDGDVEEFTPLDLDGEGRFFDDPDTDDTGCGCPAIVDMGAYEFGGTGPQPCVGDLDCDRAVGHSDLGILLAAWEQSTNGDLDCDGDTDHSDLGILLAHWGDVCP